MRLLGTLCESDYQSDLQRLTMMPSVLHILASTRPKIVHFFSIQWKTNRSIHPDSSPKSAFLGGGKIGEMWDIWLLRFHEPGFYIEEWQSLASDVVIFCFFAKTMRNDPVPSSGMNDQAGRTVLLPNSISRQPDRTGSDRNQKREWASQATGIPVAVRFILNIELMC